MKPPDLNPGDKVMYVPSHGNPEKGIVKSLCDNHHYVFVVYKCGGNWDDYQNYTAARTAIADLKKGWQNPKPIRKKENPETDLSAADQYLDDLHSSW